MRLEVRQLVVSMMIDLTHSVVTPLVIVYFSPPLQQRLGQVQKSCPIDNLLTTKFFLNWTNS